MNWDIVVYSGDIWVWNTRGVAWSKVEAWNDTMRELGHGPQQYISNVIGSGSIEVVKSSLLIDGRSMKRLWGRRHHHSTP